MRTLRRNVFTESLPSNGYTRHNTYKFGNVGLARLSFNYPVNMTTYEKIVLNIKGVSCFSTIFSCKMAVKIIDLNGN
jgi:hypothetical protein